MSTCYVGNYRIKYEDGAWLVIDRPGYTTVHTCDSHREAMQWALEHAGLKGAFDASGFAGVGKDADS